MGIKLNLIKSIILPVILYGAEIWFENRSQLKELNDIYFRALRWATNSSKLMPKAALLYEAGAKPLWLTIIGRSAKLLAKWELMDDKFTSSQWIKSVTDSQRSKGSRKWTWRTYTIKASKKVGIDIVGIINDSRSKSSKDILLPPDTQIKKGVDDYFKTWLKTEMEKCTSLNILEAELDASKEVQKQAYLYGTDHNAVRALLLVRTKTLPLNGRVSWASGTKECPFCDCDCETISHFLLKCPAYSSERKKWISTWMNNADDEWRDKFVKGSLDSQVQMLVWSHTGLEAGCRESAQYNACLKVRLKSLKDMYLKRISHAPGGNAVQVSHINTHTDQ